MIGVPNQKFWDEFDRRTYEYYKAYRDSHHDESVAEAKAATEQEFGENAGWCEAQYQSDVKRRGL